MTKTCTPYDVTHAWTDEELMDCVLESYKDFYGTRYHGSGNWDRHQMLRWLGDHFTVELKPEGECNVWHNKVPFIDDED